MTSYNSNDDSELRKMRINNRKYKILHEKNKLWKDKVDEIRREKVKTNFINKMKSIDVRRESIEDVYLSKVVKDSYHKKMLDEKEREELKRRKFKKYLEEYTKHLKYERE